MNLAPLPLHATWFTSLYQAERLWAPVIGYAPVYPLTSKPEMSCFRMQKLTCWQVLSDIYFMGKYTESAMIYLETMALLPKIEPGDMELIKSGMSDFSALTTIASRVCQSLPGRWHQRDSPGVV